MTTPDPEILIAEAIAELYAEAGLSAIPDGAGIVPLHKLVGSQNLACTELTYLSSQTAVSFLLRRGGLIEPPNAVDTEQLAGFLYAGPRYGSIFVEQQDLLVRRRFSVAHELGHYLLHFRPRFAPGEAADGLAAIASKEAFPAAGDGADPRGPTGEILMGSPGVTATLPPLPQMEDEANRFAGSLLMPTERIHALVRRYTSYFRGEDLLWRLATELLVSRAAVQRRMNDLDLRVA